MVLGVMTFLAGDAQAEDRAGDSNVSPPALPTEKDQVLLPGKVDHGGYGAPHMKVTTVAGQAGLLFGGEGAWIIGHSLMLGGGGYGLVTTADAPEPARSPSGDSSLTLGYGGVRIGYIVAPHDLLHLSASLLIGGGGVSVIEHTGSTSRTYQSASVFALEPDVALELNITAMIRAGIDASYRYMSDSKIPGLAASKIGGPSAGVLLAFGWF
jgi:hypothetical protein